MRVSACVRVCRSEQPAYEFDENTQTILKVLFYYLDGKQRTHTHTHGHTQIS